MSNRLDFSCGVDLVHGCGLPVVDHLHIGRSSGVVLGATPFKFLRIFAVDIVLGAILGLGRSALRWPPSIIVGVALFGLLVLGAGLAYGNLQLKLFIAFSAMAYGAALLSPATLAHDPVPAWDTLLSFWGGRYWYIPMLALLWSAAWCGLNASPWLVRVSGYLVLVPLLLGVARSWEYPPFNDHHFNQYVIRMQRAAPGEHVVIPLYPDGWSMELIKHKAAY